MFHDKEQFKASYLQRLEQSAGVSFANSSLQHQYQTLGMMVREYVSTNWIASNEETRKGDHKEIYYLSIEFLLGRLLVSSLINLGVKELVEEGLHDLGIELADLEEAEADAGLGNGGLGRLAACFLDSMASLELPGHGYGIRYKHGLFEQKIIDGYQVELPEQWLRNGNVWEVRKPDLAIEVPFWGDVQWIEKNGKVTFVHEHAETVLAVPFDMPVIGYNSERVNTLRLWGAEPAKHFPPHKDFMQYKRDTEQISEFLYPNDVSNEGKVLRLKQQYFLVRASLMSIIRDFKENHDDLYHFHEHVAIHINDTHPALAIPELMRIFVDEEGMRWEQAWSIVTNTFSYTNHTILSEAMEKWTIELFKPLFPRIYMIIEEINKRFCKELWQQYPGDWDRIEQMAIIAHGYVKMAHLSIVGSYSVNGVAKLHTEILKMREMKNFHNFYPDRFNNKTNGITHRRWLLQANPELTSVVSNAIGIDWIANTEKLKELSSFAGDPSFQQEVEQIKQFKKHELSRIIFERNGVAIDENSIFDVQIKRLHAYKRQLLNVLHIMHLYNRMKEDSSFKPYPRTFIFGAKAAPGYDYAKKVIKLMHSVANIVNRDPVTKDFIKIIFLENYSVSLAEKIIPATNISEQISTASKEASGTGNMKFMMNGAITLGTLDGANVEIGDLVGPENIFIFGLKAEQVMAYEKNGGYHSYDYYHNDRRIKQVVDQLTSGFFRDSYYDFESISDSLLMENDQYFLLKDFSAYTEAQEEVAASYSDRKKWLEMSIHNIAQSGFFSSDRTVAEYAKNIWNVHSNR
ncbi:glycogen/starch/alpha-glucan phosphorylase [Jeotgalibacillus sp. S-D1]|uniref:glycogen/starch/alpha-glucan phosphorylase n=1 Tax=Jeotgalibacillus sp. S-D1 TaxID=2552189 RepID=UPI00105A790A|nr:glycogen/starch/alpha-glucan phosphorylase [Jeotgalibacillus sp. S-D1]TDL30609.1 glycogen/starch/alpha-glucan phosphorylase [Jeotgalibacillus sp. S-D1]